MMKNKLLALAGLALLWSPPAAGQNVLSKEEAVRLALAHNYDIAVAKNTIATAENNADRMNSGYLPTVQTLAGANLNYNAGENKLIIGDQKFDARTSVDYNASLNVNYVIADNNGRRYNYQSLKENHNISELQARQVIENTLINLAGAYFDIALLTENAEVNQQMLSVSKQRLQREKDAYQMGQASQIAVLNAQVDMNNDSISMLNVLRELENAKRTFNLILGRDLNSDFEVDTALIFGPMANEDQLLKLAMDKNVLIAITNSQLRNSQFAIEAGKAGWFPALSANASYNFRGSQDPNGAFVTGSYAYGPRAGLSLTWNLFDGGRTSTRVQNAKIQMETQRVLQTNAAERVKLDLLNALTSYENAMFVLKVRKENVEVAKQSFERSNDRMNFGVITALEFRQSQLNYLNATMGLSQAKYDAKNIELRVMQLCGLLMEQF